MNRNEWSAINCSGKSFGQANWNVNYDIFTETLPPQKKTDKNINYIFTETLSPRKKNR